MRQLLQPNAKYRYLEERKTSGRDYGPVACLVIVLQCGTSSSPDVLDNMLPGAAANAGS